jgi:MFS-type transporter involved in bile tolerance (Atg22 family)
MMTLGADLAPKEALGEFLGIWRLIGDSGSSTGPLFVGIIAAAVGLSLTAPLIGVIGLGAATIFTFRVPETLRT